MQIPFAAALRSTPAGSTAAGSTTMRSTTAPSTNVASTNVASTTVGSAPVGSNTVAWTTVGATSAGFCAGCAADVSLERPECLDGHGDDCPEWVCVECGDAFVVGFFGVAPAPDESARHVA